MLRCKLTTSIATLLTGVMLSIHSYAGHHGSKAAWSLESKESSVSYVSIKKNSVGEVNHFKELSGSIVPSGEVAVAIDLSSVETYIDIRNKRMVKHVFGENAPKAMLKATVDMMKLKHLEVGQTIAMDIGGTLSFLGKEIPIDTTMVIAKLSDQRLMAMSDEPILVKTADLGVNAGVDKLMELAKLPGITRVVPVSLRLVFTANGKQQASAGKPASNTATQVVAVKGDAAAGRKLYRQCLGCHNAKSPEHSIGPHLVNIVGRKAAAADGFAYSEALKDSKLVWTPANLAAFLQNPAKLVPGNTMPFGGISNQSEIDNIVAYLSSLSQ